MLTDEDRPLLRFRDEDVANMYAGLLRMHRVQREEGHKGKDDKHSVASFAATRGKSRRSRTCCAPRWLALTTHVRY